VSTLRALAPAKINLGLWLGPVRASDAKHEIVTVMQSISLADEVTLELAGDALGEDEIVCPGVPGAAHENLAAAALRRFRAATGWDVGPVRLSIVKRIPVAAGLGGGSADAAAALRLLHAASGAGDEELLRGLAAALGADVPAQVAPGRWLAAGAGERIERLPDPSPPLQLLLLPLAAELQTAAVYAERDRMGAGRSHSALAERARKLRAALAGGAPAPGDAELLANDLQTAASALCPLIDPALARLRDGGAQQAFVSGSGPTVLALFPSPDGSERAARAARALAGLSPAPLRARSVSASFARATARAPGAERS
jgi:4-diphosphocytidyl-2-C-methyl-D-erythritol kinase